MTSLPPAEQEYCKQVPSVCAANATCTASNTTTGYNCSCHSGYFGDGFVNGTGCQLTTENTSDNHNVPLIAGIPLCC